MKLFSFRGGVHPPYKKELAKDRAIQVAAVSGELTVPMVQHIGAPCTPAVEVGAVVKEGQRIGEARAFVTAPVHAPVSGKVKRIDRAFHPLGQNILSIVVEPDGESAREYMSPLGDDPAKIDRESALQRVYDAGIVGLGGATFPAHVKFSPPREKKIDTFIINGCECEPYLTADYRIMMERTGDVVAGAKMIAKILGVGKIIIAVESNKPDAVERLKALEHGGEYVTLLTETKYPEGAEKVLIKALLDREVPSGGLPMDVGAIVSNVGTAVAVWEAVRDGKPLIERVVTVSGDGVKEPGNFLVRIGTPVRDLVDQAGGTVGEIGKLVIGGPMMGIAQPSLDVPVIKGTSGVLLMQRTAEMTEEYLPCIKCSFCVQACPVHLLPSKLSVIAEAERWELAEEYGANDCIECGCCTYVCPSKRPIVQWIKTAKIKLRKLKAREKR